MAEAKTHDQKQKQYIGMTENDFKGRFNMHKQSFNNPKHENSTSLSKYIWELKRTNINYYIKWSILKGAKVYVAGLRVVIYAKQRSYVLLTQTKGSY